MAEPNMTEPSPPAPDLTTLDPATPVTAAPAPAPLFCGVGVALVTLFDADGEIDPGSTGKLAASLAGRGMAAVLVNGTTGEAGTLTEDHRENISPVGPERHPGRDLAGPLCHRMGNGAVHSNAGKQHSHGSKGPEQEHCESRLSHRMVHQIRKRREVG